MCECKRLNAVESFFSLKMDAVQGQVSPPSKAKEYCFICGGIDKENDVSLFYIPSGKFSVWQRIIVKPGLTARSRLCEAHFLPSEIHKGVIVEGKFVKKPRARLFSKDVVPSKHLGGNSAFGFYFSSHM